MKYFVGLLWIAAAAVWGLLWLHQDETAARTVPSEAQAAAGNFAFRRPLIVDPSQVLPEAPAPEAQAQGEAGAPASASAPASAGADAAADVSSPAGAPAAPAPWPSAAAPMPMRIEDSPCLVLAPVAEKSLRAVNPLLRDAGLVERVIIQPYEKQSLVVYAGPYKTEAAAKRTQRAFAKANVEGGVKPSAAGSGFIVELASFTDRLEAQRWAEETARTLQAHDIAVADTGASRGKVQLVFPNLSPDENALVRRVFGRAVEGAALSACQP